MRRKELTPREKQVYELIQAGLKTKEIAEKLNLSDQRVRQLRKSVKYRLLAQDPNHSIDS